jgi:thiamine-monophosphate kinase
MGLRLLERERRVLEGIDNPQPQFEGYEYLLQRYLKPRARYDMVKSLHKEGIVPTSMIDITDGLASEVLQICKASKCGARIYLERMPLAQQTTRLAEEMNFDAVVAALNGGEDYELLFTVPLDMREKIINLGCVDIIGHITAESTGAYLVTPDGNDIALKAQGFTPKQ